MVNVFFGEHLAHIGAPGGVAYHGRAAADEGYGLVARHLEALHERKGHKVTGSQAVGCAVKADVELGFSFVYHLTDARFICDLCYKSAGFQFVVDFHFLILSGDRWCCFIVPTLPSLYF